MNYIVFPEQGMKCCDEGIYHCVQTLVFRCERTNHIDAQLFISVMMLFLAAVIYRNIDTTRRKPCRKLIYNDLDASGTGRKFLVPDHRNPHKIDLLFPVLAYHCKNRFEYD